jgi:hypothetical protein
LGAVDICFSKSIFDLLDRMIIPDARNFQIPAQSRFRESAVPRLAAHGLAIAGTIRLNDPVREE